MDSLPVSLLGPEAEVVVASFPVRQIVGHHPPGTACSDDIENAVEVAAPRLLPQLTPQSIWTIRKKWADDFPLGISQTARILTHPELLLYLAKLVAIKIALLGIFQTASN